MIHLPHAPATRALAMFLIVCVIVLNVPLPVCAGTPAAELKDIQYRYYFRGSYGRAAELLQAFLARTDLSETERLSASEFLAASLVLGGQPEEGTAVFTKLIMGPGGYGGPDPATFKPEVVAAYEGARDQVAAVRLRTAPAVTGETAPSGTSPAVEVTAEKPSKPIYKQWWLYVGLAAVAVAVGAAASSGDDAVPAPSPTGTVTVGVRIR